VGIGYNQETKHNELGEVDPKTAQVTTVASFGFDSSHWHAHLLNDAQAVMALCIESPWTAVAPKPLGS